MLALIPAELAVGRGRERIDPISTVVEAESTVLEVAPDVVVVEVLSADGIEDVAGIARRAPTIVVSSIPPEDALFPCVAAGVRGFLWKHEVTDRLDDAISLVAAGHTYLDPSSSQWLMGEIVRRHGSGSLHDDAAAEVELTTRQSEILALVNEGLSNAEIAVALGSSINTVKTHLRRAMQKLGTNGRHDAAARALADLPGPRANGSGPRTIANHVCR